MVQVETEVHMAMVATAELAAMVRQLPLVVELLVEPVVMAVLGGWAVQFVAMVVTAGTVVLAAMAVLEQPVLTVLMP